MLFSLDGGWEVECVPAQDATLVSEREVAGHREPGDSATVRVTLDASLGCRNVTQRVLRFGDGRSMRRVTSCEEVWFVAAGHGGLLLGDRWHQLEPEVGVLLDPGVAWEVDNPGGEQLVVVAVRVPSAAEPAPAGREPVVVRLADRPAIRTGDREFRILVDPEVGCKGVTQFVGWIPPGRAPTHHHTYEEVVYVLGGEGLLHLDQGSRLIGAGSCLHLPPPVEHCLENTGTTPLRVLGVFHPAGSPAAKQEADTAEDEATAEDEGTATGAATAAGESRAPRR
jgi:mannose-6-phosphate isomerase-like protein (cupin superfamily)